MNPPHRWDLSPARAESPSPAHPPRQGAGDNCRGRSLLSPFLEYRRCGNRCAPPAGSLDPRLEPRPHDGSFPLSSWAAQLPGSSSPARSVGETPHQTRRSHARWPRDGSPETLWPRLPPRSLARPADHRVRQVTIGRSGPRSPTHPRRKLSAGGRLGGDRNGRPHAGPRRPCLRLARPSYRSRHCSAARPRLHLAPSPTRTDSAGPSPRQPAPSPAQRKLSSGLAGPYPCLIFEK